MMDVIDEIAAVDLKNAAEGYDYDAESFSLLYARLKEKILAYDPDFGPYLAGHLTRVAQDTEKFMTILGYGEDTARKVGHAFSLHDIGKIKQDIELWRLTVDKRSLSEEQKFERTKHTDLGPEVLDETLTELGMELDMDQAQHLELARYLMLYHHERLDGTGPKTYTAPMMDDVLRIVAIVDTVDGKTKAKDLRQIFEDMSGHKHKGQFDDRLVSLYAKYYAESREQAGSTRPALAKNELSR